MRTVGTAPAGGDLLQRARQYLAQREVEKCLACTEDALAAGADPLDCAAERWTCFMLRGELDRAWQETDRTEEHRRRSNDSQTHLPPHLRRVWDGSLIDSENVTVRCYHGLGDTIQFVRYLPLLQDRAVSVFLDCQPALLPLLTPMFPGQRIAGQSLLDASGKPRVEIELMELPYIFRSSLATIPRRVPYLNISRAKVREAGRRCRTKGLRVGLAWRSGGWDRSRDIPLVQLAPLAEIPGVALFSLQRDHLPSEIALCHSLRITPALSEQTTITDTAATAMATDLVLSVDTMMAHLAGALGKSVWTLLPFCADWRWMLLREDSPWYPTMRLFRQPAPGNWLAVIGHVISALRELS